MNNQKSKDKGTRRKEQILGAWRTGLMLVTNQPGVSCLALLSEHRILRLRGSWWTARQAPSKGMRQCQLMYRCLERQLRVKQVQNQVAIQQQHLNKLLHQCHPSSFTNPHARLTVACTPRTGISVYLGAASSASHRCCYPPTGTWWLTRALLPWLQRLSYHQPLTMQLLHQPFTALLPHTASTLLIMGLVGIHIPQQGTWGLLCHCSSSSWLHWSAMWQKVPSCLGYPSHSHVFNRCGAPRQGGWVYGYLWQTVKEVTKDGWWVSKTIWECLNCNYPNIVHV